MDNAAKEPRATAVSHEELQESIRRRAEDIYVRSGRIPGRDVENWVGLSVKSGRSSPLVTIVERPWRSV